MSGREFTVGVLGTGETARALATLEVMLLAAPMPTAYSYRNKTQWQGLVEYRAARGRRPAHRGRSGRARDLACLGCRDAGRVDVRLDGAGRAQMLEVNPLAGLTPGYSDLPIMAELCGMAYDTLIARDSPLRRWRGSMRPRIALLHDAQAAEGRTDSSDTLAGGRAIAARWQLGYETTTVPVGLDLAALERALHALEPAAIVNLVESLDGRGQLRARRAGLARVAAACRSRVARPNALGVTSDKLAAKTLLGAAGIATPRGVRSPRPAPSAVDRESRARACVARHRRSSVVGGDRVPASAWRRAARNSAAAGSRSDSSPGRELQRGRHRGAERAARVAGRRDSLRGLSCQPSPPSSATPRSGTRDSFEYRNTVRSFAVEPELAARAQRLALVCWQLFALDGYARVDFRVDAQRHAVRARDQRQSLLVARCRLRGGARASGHRLRRGDRLADGRRAAARGTARRAT